MISEGKKETIKFWIAIFLLILVLMIVSILMIRYPVEGEKNMPFRVSKMVVLSSAEGVDKQNEKEAASWNFDIYQNNDIYFYIDQNTEIDVQDELIKNVKIENIQTVQAPKKGTIKAYMPNSEAGRLYSYDERFLVEEKLEYKGASQSSSTNLEIGSKGGTALIRISNAEIGNYASDKDKEIIHDGSLLNKIEATYEDIQFTVSFDFIIETTKNKYKTVITLNLPTGNLAEEKTSNLEKTDMSDIIFKRVK